MIWKRHPLPLSNHFINVISFRTNLKSNSFEFRFGRGVCRAWTRWVQSTCCCLPERNTADTRIKDYAANCILNRMSVTHWFSYLFSRRLFCVRGDKSIFISVWIVAFQEIYLFKYSWRISGLLHVPLFLLQCGYAPPPQSNKIKT